MSPTSAPLHALPSDAILVHIGPYKTGTTAMQSTMATAREAMAEHGVTYPGRRSAHHLEARALRQFDEGWGDDAYKAPDVARWDRFAASVRRSRGRAVMSSEYFGDCNADERAKLVRDLGADRVHLIAGCRNPAGLAVSTWQQSVRKGRPITFDEWLESTYRRSEMPDQPEGFWSRADIGAFLSRWLDLVPPTASPWSCWTRRTGAGCPTRSSSCSTCPTACSPTSGPKQSNRGLSAAEATLVLEVVRRIGSSLTWAEYSDAVRKGFVRRLLELRSPGPEEPRAVMPPWALEQAAVEADHTIERIRSLGVRIVGDLETMRTVPDVQPELGPIEQVPVDLAAEAVVGAIAAGFVGSWTLGDKGDKNRRRRSELQHEAVRAEIQARTVEATTSKELARVLLGRVRARLRRR